MPLICLLFLALGIILGLPTTTRSRMGGGAFRMCFIQPKGVERAGPSDNSLPRLSWAASFLHDRPLPCLHLVVKRHRWLTWHDQDFLEYVMPATYLQQANDHRFTLLWTLFDLTVYKGSALNFLDIRFGWQPRCTVLVWCVWVRQCCALRASAFCNRRWENI